MAMLDGEMDDSTREKFVLVLGLLIIVQAGIGGYFLMNGETSQATTAFSTLAALSGSIAALSAAISEE